MLKPEHFICYAFVITVLILFLTIIKLCQINIIEILGRVKDYCYEYCLKVKKYVKKKWWYISVVFLSLFASVFFAIYHYNGVDNLLADWLAFFKFIFKDMALFFGAITLSIILFYVVIGLLPKKSKNITAIFSEYIRMSIWISIFVFMFLTFYFIQVSAYHPFDYFGMKERLSKESISIQATKPSETLDQHNKKQVEVNTLQKEAHDNGESLEFYGAFTSGIMTPFLSLLVLFAMFKTFSIQSQKEEENRQIDEFNRKLDMYKSILENTTLKQWFYRNDYSDYPEDIGKYASLSIKEMNLEACRKGLLNLLLFKSFSDIKDFTNKEAESIKKMNLDESGKSLLELLIFKNECIDKNGAIDSSRKFLRSIMKGNFSTAKNILFIHQLPGASPKDYCECETVIFKKLLWVCCS